MLYKPCSIQFLIILFVSKYYFDIVLVVSFFEKSSELGVGTRQSGGGTGGLAHCLCTLSVLGQKPVKWENQQANRKSDVSVNISIEEELG